MIANEGKGLKLLARDSLRVMIRVITLTWQFGRWRKLGDPRFVLVSKQNRYVFAMRILFETRVVIIIARHVIGVDFGTNVLEVAIWQFTTKTLELWLFRLCL